MSIRQGRFKKQAIQQELLPAMAEKLTPALHQAFSLYEKGEISAAEMCGCYIILFVREMKGKLWLSGKRQTAAESHSGKELTQLSFLNLSPHEKLKVANLTMMDLLSIYTLSGIPEAVNRTLINWHNGKIHLNLLTYIPKPSHVLIEQSEGKRSVTMMMKPAQLSKYVLGERDPLSFLVHDLQHAARFWENTECYLGQLGFYRFIKPLVASQILSPLFAQDDRFKEEFEYAMSDMNAYSVHLVKHVHASFKEAGKRMKLGSCPWLSYIDQSVCSLEIKNIFHELYQNNSLSDHKTIQLQQFFEAYSTKEIL